MLLAGALAAITLSGVPAFAAPAAAPKSAPTPTGPGKGATEREASAQAKRTGKPVVADALTTETAQTTANPDGTLTLTQSAVPVRAFRDGAWRGLDATLKANPDGTLSPAVSVDSVVLSGGGSGPLASLHTGGQGMALTLPLALPKPVLDGNSALYPEVVPGVDLTVTVHEDGSVSDVLTVKDKRAAHDPRLKDLLNARTDTTAGLKAEADADGNLAVTDRHGRPVLTAPAPTAWDSTPVRGAVENLQAVQPKKATAGAGQAAHRAKLKPTVKDRSIELAAPADLLDAADTTYPVFLDPTYSPNWGKSAYSSPSAAYPGTKYWNSTVDPTSGITQIGNGGYGGEALSIFNFPIDQNLLHGAVVYGAYFGITETHSWACLTSGHNQSVGVYVPGATLDSTNATWNYWSGNLGSRVGDQNFAKGYNSNCPAGPINAYDITGPINQAVNDWKWTQTVALRADDHSDNYAFKEFQASTANLTITYDKKPDTPSGLYTSPATNCSSTVLGDTSVTLYAPVSTPTGSSLTTGFTLYKSGDGSHTNLLTPANGINSASYNGASGQPAVMPVPESLFKTASGGASTSFTWQAVTTDNTLTSDWSSPCTFTWDPTRPGAPTVTPTAQPPAGSASCPVVGGSGALPQIGTSCAFTLAPPMNGAVAAYQYQVNQNPPVTVSATGGATITVPVAALVNTLNVRALSAGGNLGSQTTVWYDGSKIDPPAKDGDLNLDGTPDLIVPGSGTGAFTPGLWLATGRPNGAVTQNAVNIGVNGLQFDSSTGPTDWNGAQTVTGNFCGNGAQDVLAYFPTGANAGGGTVMCSDGSTDPLHATLGNSTAPLRIAGGSLFGTDRSPATQVVTAGNTSSRSTGHPDLLAVTGGDLVLHWSTTSNGYSNTDPDWGSTCLGNCTVLSGLNSPDGTHDWNNWRIATTQLADGTAAYLWNPATGALHLWTGLKATTDGTTLTTTGTYTIAASGWNTGKNLTLRAADLTGSGIPGLWATDTAGGTSTSYVPAALANTPALKATATSMTQPNHAWMFQDIADHQPGSPLSATADTVGSLGLTGTSGAQWHTGDVFSPDVLLNTGVDGTPSSNGTGVLSTSTAAVNTAGSFTVSVWTKPDAMDGTLLSQDGNTGAGFKLYIDASKHWVFCLATADSANPSWDCAGTGAAVRLGAWTHLTATYNQSTNKLALYANGIVANTAAHTAVAGFTKGLRVGDVLANGTHQSFYRGAVANLQTWNGTALTPTQVALLSGVPGYVMFPSDDTNYPSGTTWTAGHATMSFRSGVLTISNPGYGTWTYGTAGASTSVMSLQADGNLVAYPQAAHTTGTALWGTSTNNSPGDVMFFQPDGNLVIYKADGTPIWSSNTYSHGLRDTAATNESGGTGKLRYADFDGDGRADAITIADNGAVSVKLNAGGDGHGGWADLGQVTGGVTTDRTKVRFADFDGDGKADYLVFNGGAVNLWLNVGGDGRGGWIYYGQITTGSTGNPDQVRFADFDGDGKADYILTQPSGAVGVFLNKGGDGHGGWQDLGQVATGTTGDITRIRWADLDGDGRADYTVVNADGSITSYINHGGDTGSGWVLRPTVSAGHTTTQGQVYFTDLDGDGRGDYLLLNGTTNAWLSNGGDDFATPGWTDLGQILGTV
ncbi:FG-GAP-like repeat-containing protein [Kitasatospora cineracea]|uniref:VCBS repeat protein n=1 Tax=Kitasatospora cineracea TaxID=88074 RepID=A0A8G1XBW0_9ACTN|nr:FG-GAP-like repeat-containing protein [Kitasatospora cineracea]ROR44690.1 VCBS repeat protein [Kitasatospora cineracea]